MGVNIGWIFGSVAFFSVVWAFFFFPELKVRKSRPRQTIYAMLSNSYSLSLCVFC